MYLDSSVVAGLALVGVIIIASGVGLALLRGAMRRDGERARR